MAPHDPMAIILAILVDPHEMTLHAKYQGSRSFSFREEDFLSFFYTFLCKTGSSPGVAPIDPRGIILAILVDLHEMTIHAKYQGSRPFGFGGEDFLMFFYIFLCKNPKIARAWPHVTPGS